MTGNDIPRYYLLGITNTNKQVPIFVYFMSILTKMFIHRCKNTDIKPTIQNLKKYIQQTEKLERNVATGRGRSNLEKHLDKWSPFIEQDIGRPRNY